MNARRSPSPPARTDARDVLDANAERLRAFNRFFTRRIGVVGERVLGSPFSLAETRVLWEIGHVPPAGTPTASALVRALGLDAGHLSRVLAGLRDAGLVSVSADAADRRRRLLRLTAAGRRALAPLERRSQREMRDLLAPLAPSAQHELLAAAARMQALLDGAAADEAPRATPPHAAPAGSAHTGDGALRDPFARPSRDARRTPLRASRGIASRAAQDVTLHAAQDVTLRALRAGDLGWVVSRHGALYASEFGWDGRFEALVARIAADFVDRFDARREACWIAVRPAAAGAADARPRPGSGANACGADAGDEGDEGDEGETRMGCVFLVRARDAHSGAVVPGVAQLRMLLVEPAARGSGLGQRLVQTCEDFARAHGYRRIRLWTNSVLLAARHIYERAGYRHVASEAHRSFGQRLVGETWELELAR